MALLKQYRYFVDTVKKSELSFYLIMLANKIIFEKKETQIAITSIAL